MTANFAEWVAGLGPGVANHLWQTTAFAAAAWLVTLALRQNQARVRYAVWLAASMKFLVPFSLLMAAGNLLPHPRQAVAPVVYSAMDVVEEPFAEMPPFVAPAVHVPTMKERIEAELPMALFGLWVIGAGLVLLRWGRGWRIARRTLRDAEVVGEGREWEILRRVEGGVPGAKAPNDLAAEMPGLKSRPISEARANAGILRRWLRMTGSKGSGVNLAKRVGDAAAKAAPSMECCYGTPEGVPLSKTKANAGVPRLRRFAASLGMTASTSELQAEDGYTGGIELRLSAERMEPGIFGVWRPVLVWPRELSARLDDEHIEAIVAHELAHVRRRDNLTSMLHMVVETVFWFHPAVWWMERQMVKEREQACDEAVVSMGGDLSSPPVSLRDTDGAPGDTTDVRTDYAEIYAEALLKTCRFCIESPLVCVAGVTGADLKHRVMEIVTGRALKEMSWAKKAMLAASALCVIAAPVVLGQAKAAQRLMLAAIQGAPKPVQQVAKAVMADAESVSSGIAADAPQTAAAAPTADASPTASPFVLDVVSIRPSDPNVRGPLVFGPQPDGFIALNMPLYTILSLFYGPELQNDVNRIEGGPQWAKETPWIIRAKIAQDEVAEWSKVVFSRDPEAQSVRNATIQAMLASRFKLKTHFETREGTVYSLVVAKGGLKMKESAPDERQLISGHGTSTTFQKASMSTILTTIAQRVGSPVVDKTGLTGNYDFTLDSTPLYGAPPPSTDAGASLDAAPSILNAVEEQLGLKLVAEKGPVRHLVIDHVEQPSVDGAEVGSGDEGQLSGAYRKWLDEDAHWLMTPQERADFLKLGSDKDRDAFIDSFWEKRNPPGAAKDAYKAEVYARIAYANDHFAVIGKPGWATDRGRAYIVYGRPDSIDVHPSDGYEVWNYSHLGGVGGSASLKFVSKDGDYDLEGAWPQVSAASVSTMTFDVASIRPDPATAGSYFRYLAGGRLSAMSWIKQVIQLAYGLKDYQVTGGPGWLGTDRYDIEAKAPNQDATKDEINAMTQTLLADRFHLHYHVEQKEMDVYDLVVDSGGAKLKPLKDGEDFHCTRDNTEICGITDPARLADWMKHFAGRPVLDKTGIAGRYEILLTFDVYSASGATPPEGYNRPLLADALREQLGLKLVPHKETMPVLVVDSIERPTEN